MTEVHNLGAESLIVGPKCPSCDSSKLACKTHINKGWVFGRWTCKDCGFKFNTRDRVEA